MRTAVLFFTLLSTAVSTSAQVDTVLQLQSVTIEQSRLALTGYGLHDQRFDSLLLLRHRQSSLAELLGNNNASYIKSYGPGMLAGLSLRGGSVYHTSFLWNGVPLASPLNGVTDLSLLPVFLFDNIRLQYGGSPTPGGNGAVSGTVEMSNRSRFGEGFRVESGAGYSGVGLFVENVGLNFSSNSCSGSLRAYRQHGDNHFAFSDPNSGATRKQENAAIDQAGILSDNHFILGNLAQVNAAIWLSGSTREIPPALYQSDTQAKQQDRTIRVTAGWKQPVGRFNFVVRSSFLREKQTYDEATLRTPSDNTGKHFINEAGIETNHARFHALGAGVVHDLASSDSSTEVIHAHVHETALYAFYRYTAPKENFRFVATGRKTFSSLNSSPFTGSLGASFLILPGLTLRAGASRVFRNPTLNDLYWKPGGNPNLLPETGFSGETGMDIDVFPLLKWRRHPSSTWRLALTGYYKKIENWIAWYPFTATLWKPENLLRVDSRGIESKVSYEIRRAFLKCGIDLEYLFTRSTTEQSLLTNDASLHRQLIYVPVNTWQLKFHLGYNKTALYFCHTYTGHRYTLSDNTAWLTPYSFATVRLDHTLNLHSSSVLLFVAVNNLYDTNYQTIQSRPMPLRYFEAGFNFSFQKKSNKKTHE
jgi:iron complex outermembrane receptor protein